MRTDEFFEVLGGLDDSLIINARNTPDNTVKINVERVSWKPFAAAAACFVALIAVVALSFGKITDFVKNAGSNYGYPEDAVYKYTGDFKKLKLSYNQLLSLSFDFDFNKLENSSDLIVEGTFIDNARQTEPLTGETKSDFYDYTKFGMSYNKLRIDHVFKGSAEVGDEIIIGDRYFVNDEHLYYFVRIAFTPMLKGDKWVYFLKQSESGGNVYDPLPDGRYPIPGEENDFAAYLDLSSMDYTLNYDYFEVDEEVYADVKIMLGYVEGVQKLELDDRAEGCGFVMPEFLGDVFSVRRSDIYLANTSRVLTEARGGFLNLYLADLNGDGKREIISECWNGLSGLSASYITVYDHANSKRYALAGEFYTSYRPEIRDGILYAVEYKTGANVDEISAVPLTLDILTELELAADELIAYDGETYKIVKSLYTEEGARFMIGLTSLEYEAGEYIKVLGVVENDTDKEISLHTPVMGEGSHTEIGTVIKQGNVRLKDISVEDRVFDMAESYTVVEPGERYYQAMLFDTRVERLDDYDTLLPLLLPLGNYEGSACIHLLSDTHDSGSETTYYGLDFDVSVVQRREVEYPEEDVYRVDELGGYTELKFNRRKVRACDSQGEFELFGGTPIENLYLIDLNGDGKREVCATVSYGSGIVDSRIMVYDLKNRKLYELSDRVYYDYYLRVGREVDGSYFPTYEKYRYNGHELVWRGEVLTLDMMTEISRQSDSVREPVTGASELTELGKSFTMSEFPGCTFYMGHTDDNKIGVFRKNGEEKCFEAGFKSISKIYLYDITGDGKREILVEGTTQPISFSGDPVGDPIQMLTAIDIEFDWGWNMYPDKTECHFTIVDGELHIMVGGEVLPEPLTYEQFETLAKSEIMW